MWGQTGPYVVEIVWAEKMRQSFHVFDTQHEAQAFTQKFQRRPDIFAIRAWDVSGGWQV